MRAKLVEKQTIMVLIVYFPSQLSNILYNARLRIIDMTILIYYLSFVLLLYMSDPTNL